LGDDVYVGLYVCSHNDAVSEQAIFRNVRVVVPAKDDFVPYKDYLGSNLEILDVESGHRQIIYSLIYNSNGRLYRFELSSKTPVVIDTGFATRNNNDHVLSFDGKMIAISHHSEEDRNNSIVYTLPIPHTAHPICMAGHPMASSSHIPAHETAHLISIPYRLMGARKPS
jgi:TolB protein